MNKQQFSAKIQGTVYGDIWMPQTECSKPVSEVARDDDTLRDLVLRMTNDGDFRDSGLTKDSVLVVTLIKSNRRITRFFDITLFPSITDCIGKKESYELEATDD